MVVEIEITENGYSYTAKINGWSVYGMLTNHETLDGLHRAVSWVSLAHRNEEFVIGVPTRSDLVPNLPGVRVKVIPVTSGEGPISIMYFLSQLPA